ncbi:MAG: SusC/RagA family TonB-linked outer membrane protein [Gemmatimonadaceae bacterium]
MASFLALLPAIAAAQGREITGKVTQSASGAPITEATVGLLGAQNGVRTNERGEYRLRIPSNGATILVRAIGFKRVTKVVTSEATADFALDKDVLQLEGVTVTGQATTVDRRNASTAIASVSAEELTQAPSKSLEGNLAGKVVGATVFENSGTPGGGMQIQIRGATSILGQGDPLYIVDGIIVSNASVSGGLASITRSSGSTNSSQDQVVNRLADFNPNDIENIEVLKSAAATAIYGSRATNGVVVITTKRGKAGTTRYNLTQRVGTQQATRLLGSRQFTSYAQVQPWLGASPQADSVAKANCTPACPNYDWEGQLYGNHAPSFETVLSSSGGAANTRYFGSLNDRQTKGVQLNTGARRTSGRINLDQTIGDKWTVAMGIDVTHNFIQNGIGNNDNSGTSPIYLFGYSPHIYDLQQRDANTGRPITFFLNGGGNTVANPFETLTSITNNEDTWRQTGSVRVNYALLSGVKNNISVSFIGGVDRYQLEGLQYSPNYLQFESADGFPGTSQISSIDSKQLNQSINAVHTYTPGWSFLNSMQTSVGGTDEAQELNPFSVRMRGLTPTRQAATNGSDIATTNGTIVKFRDQSMYFNEQVIGLNEKLSMSFGVRADRGSANGDREKFYSFPKFSASYRFVEPLSRVTKAVDEVKLRASFGRSGNRPNFGVRDITIASGGVIGGLGSLVASGTLGNPEIRPEVMNEKEYGLDAAMFDGRVSLEGSYYNRVIKDLLVTFPLPASSGLTSQTINGGTMSTKGFEAGINFVPISRKNLEWTMRATYQTNDQMVDELLVPAFAVTGSFGSSYGRNRIAQGVKPTLIWGNVKYTCVNTTDAAGAISNKTGADGQPCHRLNPSDAAVAGSVTRDSIIADANPIGQTSFLNTIRYKSFQITGLLDWRQGGFTSDMTKNLFDEGGNSRDYDAASPVANQTLGQYRYGSFSGGNIAEYIENGTFLKLREINVSYQAPASLASKFRARDMRVSVQGRNLWTKSNYWSFDPEFSNFGNSNFNRFIDLAPYPTNRQFYFSIDLGY